MIHQLPSVAASATTIQPPSPSATSSAGRSPNRTGPSDVPDGRQSSPGWHGPRSTRSIVAPPGPRYEICEDAAAAQVVLALVDEPASRQDRAVHVEGKSVGGVGVEVAVVVGARAGRGGPAGRAGRVGRGGRFRWRLAVGRLGRQVLACRGRARRDRTRRPPKRARAMAEPIHRPVSRCAGDDGPGPPAQPATTAARATSTAKPRAPER